MLLCLRHEPSGKIDGAANDGELSPLSCALYAVIASATGSSNAADDSNLAQPIMRPEAHFAETQPERIWGAFRFDFWTNFGS